MRVLFSYMKSYAFLYIFLILINQIVYKHNLVKKKKNPEEPGEVVEMTTRVQRTKGPFRFTFIRSSTITNSSSYHASITFTLGNSTLLTHQNSANNILERCQLSD